jgi:hypothetical protein
MGLNSFDGEVTFNMLGGLSIPDRTTPESVRITNIEGLIPPWRTIDQKGATQDGVTFVDALYDPSEVIIDAQIAGRDPAHCRRVARHLYDSLDVKQESELWWFTHDMGRWWAPVRWFKNPVDKVSSISKKTQPVTLRLRADNAFWQSYPSVDEFIFAYEAAVDEFNVDDVDDLGTGWTTSVTGAGTGGLFVDDGHAQFSLLDNRTAVARKNSYTSATDNQVIEIQIGRLGQWFYPLGAHLHIWGRLNNTSTPGISGVRLHIERHILMLSYFVGGVQTVLRLQPMIIPPQPGEKFRLIIGDETGPRVFKVMRGGATIMRVVESGTGSPVGASNRSAGFGGTSDNPYFHPASIRRWAVGDNTTVSQTGFMERYNVGDQPMWDNYTCFGPGTFRFWNGPNAGTNEYVEFGPLLPGQVMHVRTDPRRRGVVDMTSTPPTPQHLNLFQRALRDFLSFATGNNATPLALELESWFGILPPPSGSAAPAYHVKVQIDDGNADSKIIVAGTPMRRMPF